MVNEKKRSQNRLSINKVQVVVCSFHVDCQAGCKEDTQGFWVFQQVHSGIGY